MTDDRNLTRQDENADTVDKPKNKGWLGRLFGGQKETPDVHPTPEPPANPEPDVGPVPEPEQTPPPAPGPDVEPIPEPDPAPDRKPIPEPEEPQPVPRPERPAPGTGPVMEKKNWFQRLRNGLTRSSSRLTQGITDVFTKRRLDDEALEDLEDLLITADLGVKTAARLSAALAKNRFGKDVEPEEVRTVLSDEITSILAPVAQPLEIDATKKPHVVLVVGVNGAGKTTTIGKMGKQFRDQGLKVTMAAGDTFRAAAVEQLKVWGDRTGCPVVARDSGADAAGLVFDALQDSRKRGDDVLLIDTAGRLHNKSELMDELRKIRRVIQKVDPDAPHTTLLVLDATVGQNAHQQVKVFGEMVEVTGLVMTKLDGTAKGGVVVALAEDFGLPVHYVGVGEAAEDLRPFRAEDFARGLMGL